MKKKVFKHPDGHLVIKSKERNHVFGKRTGKTNLFSLTVKNFAGELTPEIESQLKYIGIFNVYN